MEFLSRTQTAGNGSSSSEPDFTKLQTTGSDRRSKVGSESSHNHAVNHLVRGLIDLLPKSDSIWSAEDRVKWLRLATDIFEVSYKPGDSESTEISIVVIKQVSAKSKV
jgi:hypothetical protein